MRPQRKPRMGREMKLQTMRQMKRGMKLQM